MTAICPDCARTCCTECVADDEHRGSRMPPSLPSLDPAFIDALREPVPEEAKREKEEGT